MTIPTRVVVACATSLLASGATVEQARALFEIAFAEELGNIRTMGICSAIGVQTNMCTPALALYGSDQLKAGRIGDVVVGTCHNHLSCFKRLTKRIKGRFGKFRQLVKKQHPTMRQ